MQKRWEDFNTELYWIYVVSATCQTVDLFLTVPGIQQKTDLGRILTYLGVPRFTHLVQGQAVRGTNKN